MFFLCIAPKGKILILCYFKQYIDGQSVKYIFPARSCLVSDEPARLSANVLCAIDPAVEILRRARDGRASKGQAGRSSRVDERSPLAHGFLQPGSFFTECGVYCGAVSLTEYSVNTFTRITPLGLRTSSKSVSAFLPY
jgi:hypothetical protein